jgi:LysR family transcriptional regulator, glycine cleavage system transcriptional activator
MAARRASGNLAELERERRSPLDFRPCSVRVPTYNLFDFSVSGRKLGVTLGTHNGQSPAMKGLRTKLPPPNSLLTFEAAARHQSFTRAARELNVTQTAVSRQIKTLEDHLGLAVFRRVRRSVQLTSEGKRLHEAVMAGLNHIAEIVIELQKVRPRPHLTVATTLAFSSFWLIRRIPDFRARFPEIELRIMTSDANLDLLAEDVDVAVRYGSGKWPGLSATRLFTAEVFPVCSPSLLETVPIHTPADLLKAPLLELEASDTSWIDWANWLQEVGLGAKRLRRLLTFNNLPLLIQAAIDGQGIALGWTPYVTELLALGKLVRPIETVVRPANAYYLVTPLGSGNPNSATFSDWIREQATALAPALPVVPGPLQSA